MRSTKNKMSRHGESKNVWRCSNVANMSHQLLTEFVGDDVGDFDGDEVATPMRRHFLSSLSHEQPSSSLSLHILLRVMEGQSTELKLLSSLLLGVLPTCSRERWRPKSPLVMSGMGSDPVYWGIKLSPVAAGQPQSAVE